MVKINSPKKNILYITFLGILEPVAYSQVFSYILELSRENNLKFTLLSCEKKAFLKRKDYLKIEDIRRQFEKKGVGWHILMHRRGWAKLYNFVECFVYSIFLVLRDKIDVIHTRSGEPAIIAALICKIFKIKLLYDRRGMIAEDYSDDATTGFKIKKDGLAYRLLNRVDRKIMLESEATVVLTERVHKLIEEDRSFRSKNTIHVIPCCVNLEVYSRYLKNSSELLSSLNLQDRFILNYTGSLCNLHSLTEMLDFFKVAKKVIANAHFMFLTLVDKALLEVEIENNGLDIKDFTIISTSPLKVNEYLSICDASLMFFKPTLIRLAASPTKFAECLASGLPIIINKNIGDTEAVIEKNGVGVIVEDFSEQNYLAALQRLLKLLNEPELRLRCRKTAESNFSLQLGVERYKKIYDSLLT